MWPGVQPAEGETDDDYLNSMVQIAENLYSYGIYTLVGQTSLLFYC